MVEGPGATRNADKAKKLVGWKVLNAVKKSDDVPALHGSVMNESFCVGKEVFLCFNNDMTYRLHFGMNGSLCIRTKNSKVDPWKANDTTLSINFVNEEDGRVMILECYGSTLCETTFLVAKSKYERMHQLDICGNTFEIAQAIASVKTRPDSMISDVLLDQNKVRLVLPCAVFV